MSLLDLHNTPHDMYQPSKRARPALPRIGKEHARSDPPAGDRNAREAWMRDKQARKRLQARRRV